jgi:hypothetical protein
MSFSITQNLTNQNTTQITEFSYRKWDVWEKLLLTLLIFGTIGNLLTIAVMRSKKMCKTHESLIITCISISDISLLSIKFFVNMQKMYRIPIFNACIFIHYVLPQIIAWFVYWLIVVITIERFIAVSNPFHVNILFSKKRCRCVILTLFCIFTVLSSTQAVCLRGSKRQPYYCSIRKLELFSNSTDVCLSYMKNIFPWIKSALMSWIPWILAFIFNFLIVFSLRKAERLRRIISILPRVRSNNSIELLSRNASMTRLNSLITSYGCSESQSSYRKILNTRKIKMLNNLKLYQRDLKEKQITITLCTISFSFLLFTAPYTIFELMRNLNGNAVFNNRDLHRFVLFLLDCLHVTNFIFYCLIGKRFRKELKRFLKIKMNLYEEKFSFKNSVTSKNYNSLRDNNVGGKQKIKHLTL